MKKTIKNLIPSFLDYSPVHWQLSSSTVEKYQESINRIIKEVGNLEVGSINLEQILRLKRNLIQQELSPSRINSIIFALRKFLRYCQEVLKIETLNPSEIKPQKIPKQDVVYLTNEEVKKFIEVIDTSKMYGLRFRVLTEVLLSSGMRISEALSLNWDDVDWKNKEAQIVGKGNKQRTIYFNDRSLYWLKKYKKIRWDSEEPVFVTQDGQPRRWGKGCTEREFRKYREKSGIKKKISPHILRHSTATNMLFNGADVTFVKEILGHEDIETTCRYYLGLDKRKVKEAHRKYLNFEN